ncbi:MAG: dodecin flavoprotein [Sphingobium sp.]|uniref:dodecin n=1 Tax=Sphingobium sp. TaxID=1912891 RepID=UPI000DB27B56|nr:dodecin [Sphingobium sp.]PZU08993.1 MAG: dodecin flavoprotein [Sphingobium sp.]
MTNHVAKIVEVVGTSDSSVDDAIKGAIAKASETLDNLQWFEVVQIRGAVEGTQVQRFQVILKIAFGLEE